MSLDKVAALKATLYLALLVGLAVLILKMPERAVAALVLPVLLAALWWLLYSSLRR